MAEHTDSLRRFLISKGASADDLDDLVQETFAVVWNKFAKIVHGKEKSFLYSTAVRELRAHHRKAIKRKKLCQEFMALHRHWASSVSPVDEAAMAREQESLVRRLLSNLPARTQQVVRMVHFEGHSVVHAARVMGISPVTAYHLLERGTKRLRKSVENETVS